MPNLETWRLGFNFSINLLCSFHIFTIICPYHLYNALIDFSTVVIILFPLPNKLFWGEKSLLRSVLYSCLVCFTIPAPIATRVTIINTICPYISLLQAGQWPHIAYIFKFKFLSRLCIYGPPWCSSYLTFTLLTILPTISSRTHVDFLRVFQWAVYLHPTQKALSTTNALTSNFNFTFDLQSWVVWVTPSHSSKWSTKTCVSSIFSTHNLLVSNTAAFNSLFNPLPLDI